MSGGNGSAFPSNGGDSRSHAARICKELIMGIQSYAISSSSAEIPDIRTWKEAISFWESNDKLALYNLIPRASDSSNQKAFLGRMNALGVQEHALAAILGLERTEFLEIILKRDVDAATSWLYGKRVHLPILAMGVRMCLDAYWPSPVREFLSKQFVSGNVEYSFVAAELENHHKAKKHNPLKHFVPLLLDNLGLASEVFLKFTTNGKKTANGDDFKLSLVRQFGCNGNGATTGMLQKKGIRL